MARDFDGTNDNIAFGSDASVDNFTARTYAFWMQWDGSGAIDAIVVKSANNTTSMFGVLTSNTNFIRFLYAWSGAGPATWVGDTDVSGGGLFHVMVRYNNSADTNDPVIQINGQADTLTESVAPSGTPSSDAANTLRIGETDAGAADFDGRIQNFAYDNTSWSNAQANRHRWHGRPGGACVVLHPMYTDKLVNEGTGTADGTATNTTVTSTIPRCSRPGCGVF